ncbi:MAG TPA: BON domain-containing protein [Methylovorus sp.]|jgi:hyperosmotically inducible periplasmic protein|nr:BON domain-containing protein [Methylovorus sp.]
MKTIRTSHIATLALLAGVGFANTPAFAFGTADTIDQSPLATEFRNLDTNSNDLLTPAEASKDKLFTKKHFKAADVDGDGTLDQQEYSDYKSKDQKKNAKRVINDSVITSKIKANILKDEGFKGLEISVETHNGVVQLSGFVDNKAQIERAKEIAAATEGVKSVHNSLIVKG